MKKRVTDNFEIRLKALMLHQGLTVVMLSDASDIEQTHLRQFLGGAFYPSYVNIKKLCVALDVKADYLLGLEGKEST